MSIKIGGLLRSSKRGDLDVGGQSPMGRFQTLALRDEKVSKVIVLVRRARGKRKTARNARRQSRRRLRRLQPLLRQYLAAPI